MNTRHRFGFVSTRLAGTDGVSLEAAKWVRVLNELGHECFFFAGELDWPADRSLRVPEAHFEHPEIRRLNADLFDDTERSPETSLAVDRLKHHLKERLRQFVEQFDLNVLVVQNALAIPMNVPLGLALTELIAETNIATLAHHHDFSWERTRFSVTAADDYLRAAFPPTLNSITHVVINSFAHRQLAYRTGLSSLVIPNVMDFERAPPAPDGYADDLRAVLGIGNDEYFLLQPTRVVPRKRIELAINLVHQLDLPATLVVSHSSGDEGSEYLAFLHEYIGMCGVKVKFAEELFNGVRGTRPGGGKVYSLEDAYGPADLVTYPSTIEGFGNAFLEAIYCRKPIVMSAYEIYRTDIKPKGFRVVEFGDYITRETIEATRRVLTDPGLAAEMTDHNYEVARHHFSFGNLQRLLDAMVSLRVGR